MTTLKFSSHLLVFLLLAGCSRGQSKPVQSSGTAKATSGSSLLRARLGFRTHVIPATERGERMPVAPAKVFLTVKYPSPAGNLAAYVSPDPRDGKKHPAIVWITGGDCNSIGDIWSPRSPDNDQSAAAFRKAGILMMFPSLRGGNDNPGVKEGFLNEVNDVLAATNWLAKQTYVDPKRIYLGGHSTGGTLALLVAETTPRFRATFAFGAVADVRGYGADSGFLPYDITDKNESLVRSPGYWLDSIHSPTWLIEGTKGNIDSLREMKEIAGKLPPNPNLHFVEVNEASHFNVLAPTNELLARKVVADTGPTCNITINESEVNHSFSG
ncbi:hypothetical protein IAD21_04775 [Abditibacteriota bacterium]|nr:hypothetical protein IAD21_04775 [Abditibacteriota bacterium]